MSKHTEIGTNGEIHAANFLKNKGFEIVATNWRTGKKEIDIIAIYQNNIVFVEVKTRSNLTFGFPEEAVTEQKKILLKQAAEVYCTQTENSRNIRFDIISIILIRGVVQEIVHIEDAFY